MAALETVGAEVARIGGQDAAMAQLFGQQHQRGVRQIHRQAGVARHQLHHALGLCQGPGPNGDGAIGHLVSRVEDTVSKLLRDASVQAAGVDSVFFTGGSSSVPLLRERIAALLPQARRVEGDLFGSIGAGLALDALRKFG